MPYLLSRLHSLETQGLGDSSGLSTLCQVLWDPPTGQALEMFSAIKDRPWTSYRPEVGRLAHRLNPAQRRALFGPQCLIWISCQPWKYETPYTNPDVGILRKNWKMKLCGGDPLWVRQLLLTRSPHISHFTHGRYLPKPCMHVGMWPVPEATVLS